VQPGGGQQGAVVAAGAAAGKQQQGAAYSRSGSPLQRPQLATPLRSLVLSSVECLSAPIRRVTSGLTI
jgi:hypothetical protein